MEGLAVLKPLSLTLKSGVPAQLTAFRGRRELRVQPWRPRFQDPTAFGRRWWVSRRCDPAALLRIVGAVPAQKKTLLLAGKLRQLVKRHQVVRPALIPGGRGWATIAQLPDPRPGPVQVIVAAPALGPRPIRTASV